MAACICFVCMKKLLKDYFSFSKKERVAVVVLLTLTGIFLVWPYFFEPDVAPPPSTGIPVKDSVAVVSAVADKPMPRTLFYFNPNTITAEEWKALGLRDRTVKTILNYREKGGRFRQASDIRKIWGLAPSEVEAILPFVRLPPLERPPKRERETVIWKPRKVLHSININTATVEEWKALPGIGEVLANRLVRFREKSGGFRSVEQVGKTYGLSDSVFNQLRPYLQLDSSFNSAVR